MSGTIICSHRLCSFRNRWIYKGTHYFEPTFPKNRKSHHLCRQCQDLFHNHGYKERVLSRIVSCNLLDIHKCRTYPKRQQSQEELVNMINTLRLVYDHLLASPFLTKKDDPAVPMIECTIGERIFHKTFATLDRVLT